MLPIRSISYRKVGPDGTVLSEKERNSVMYLVKVLFRLNVIDEEQALQIATQYHILFV
jgi:hypothetical protein